MKINILLLALLASFTNCKPGKKIKEEQSTLKKPNVVLIVVDDLGWTDLSDAGSDYYQTPNVDNLMKEGMKFTNGYSACTVCSPSRAALLSGKYPANLNCTDWISGHEMPWAKLAIPEWIHFLDNDEVTLAEFLQADGYNTIHLGKWHLGDEEKYWPEHQGFEVNIGGYAKGRPLCFL